MSKEEAKKSKVFRKVSLDRLSSPEQLDQLMQVTSPKGWIALLTIVGGVLLAIIWGFVGTIPEKVNGQGILLKSGGVTEVLSTASGRITDIRTIAGDIVQKGEVVARLGQPELLLEINNMKEQLKELKTKRDRFAFFGTGVTTLRQEQLIHQRKNLETQIAASKERAGLLENMIMRQEDLLGRGLITENALISTKNELTSVRAAISSYENEIRQLGVGEVGTERDQELELLSLNNQITEQERHIERLWTEYELSTRVISPYAGRVLEVRRKVSDLTQQGDAIMSMELLGREVKALEAVLFFPAGEGKKIEAGMNVQLAPSTINREEYGTLVAKVTMVSEYASTPDGIMKELGNEQLVTELTSNTAVIKIIADLIPDPETYSGYRWSSAQGPPTSIVSGTITDATVTVRQRRPISLVMPFFRRVSGIYDVF